MRTDDDLDYCEDEDDDHRCQCGRYLPDRGCWWCQECEEDLCEQCARDGKAEDSRGRRLTLCAECLEVWTVELLMPSLSAAWLW